MNKLLLIVLSTVLLAGCQVEGLGGSGFGTGGGIDASDGRVSLYWSVPSQRVNGESLSITELDGYELRYRRKSGTAYTKVKIEDPETTQYHIDGIDAENYEFNIATIDKDGVYSQFVSAMN